MKFPLQYFFAFIILIGSCKPAPKNIKTTLDLLQELPSIKGKNSYLSSGYITPGNRVYSIGHQDGTFPPIGWHIAGEMGGVWNHPIKLLDGFSASVTSGGVTTPLATAHTFENFPFANTHSYALASQFLKIVRSQFVPDHKEGMVVVFEIENTSEKQQQISFDFSAVSDLKPTWLGERTQMHNGTDEARFNKHENIFVVKDKENPWWVVFGSNTAVSAQTTTEGVQEKTTVSTMSFALNIKPASSQEIKFFIAGTTDTEAATLETFKDLKDNHENLLLEKIRRYKSLANNSLLKTPDTLLNQTFQWLKYNSDAFVRTVPGHGSAIAAGYPDYPWWFGCDSEYALQGYMAIGQQEVVKSTIELLAEISEATNGNGRIVHEASTNGAVFNPGNINETPQFTSLLWKAYLWNGDKEFLSKHFKTAKKGLEWLLNTQDKNGNLIPEGAGMMEIHGLDSEMIDVAAYTQKAFADAALIAQTLGEPFLAKDYKNKARLIAKRINTQFWSEEFNSYADFIGSDQEALRLIEDAIVRADTLKKPWAVAELKETKAYIAKHPSVTDRPFVLHHNWVVNTPMEVGLASFENATKALKTAKAFTNPFGVFVTGIDRDASAGTDQGSFKGSKQFSYTGAVMTLPTGVLAVAENNYGNPDQALNYLQKMCRTFSYALPGSLYEVSPDYGMFTQAWNLYSFAVPIVTQFFGLEPHVALKELQIAPKMPSHWKEASIENVLMGSNAVSIYYTKKGSEIRLEVKQLEDWKINIGPLTGHKLKQKNKATLTTTYIFTQNEK